MKYFSMVLALTIMASGLARAAAFDELNDADKAKVEAGGVVYRSVSDSSSALPKMYVYRFIDATPEEGVAVFTDFELQKSYVPDLIMSEVDSRPTPSSANVNYELKTPFPVPHEHYTAQITMAQYDDGASYRADWKLLHADTTKDTVGSARFETHGSKTFLAYYNFITPGSRFAGLIRDRAATQVKNTVIAFVGQIADEKTSNPALLQKQINDLEAALK